MKLTDLSLRPWLISDRPPLSYGMHAWIRLLSLLITRDNDGDSIAPFMHTIAGIVVEHGMGAGSVHIFVSWE